MAGIWLPLTWKIQQTKSLVKRAKHHQWWQALDRAFSFLCWVIKREKGIVARFSHKVLKTATQNVRNML